MSSFKTNISPGMKRIVQILLVLFACSAIFLRNTFADDPAENSAESGSGSTVSTGAVSTGAVSTGTTSAGATEPAKTKSWTVSPTDDWIYITHSSGYETPEYKQNVVGFDGFWDPDNDSDYHFATPENSTFQLKVVPNSDPALEYDVDTTPKSIQVEEEGETVTRNIIGTITGNHPLKGSYLTDKGDFVVIENSAPDGTYEFAYTLCAKEVPGKIESSCADRKIIVEIAEYVEPDTSYLRVHDDKISITRQEDSSFNEMTFEIAKGVSFYAMNYSTYEDIGIENVSTTLDESSIPSELKGKISLDGKTLKLAASAYPAGVYSIPYTLCGDSPKGKHACDSMVITLQVNIRAGEAKYHAEAQADDITIERMDDEENPEVVYDLMENDRIVDEFDSAQP